MTSGSGRSGSGLDRRAVLERGGATLGTAVLGSLAGCGFLSSEEDTDEVDVGRATAVPAADAFVHADLDSLVADTALQRGVDRRLAAMPAETWPGVRPESMGEALVVLDRRFGLDGTAVSELLVFGTLGAGGGVDGVLLWGGWDAPAERLAAHETTSAVGTLRGTTVYRDGETAVAAVDGGPVAVGTGDAVRSAIAVAAGAGEAVADHLAEAFGRTSGSIRFASRVSPSLFSVGAASDWVSLRPLERAGPLSGSLHAHDGDRRLRATVEAESERAAADVRALANGARAQAEQNVGAIAADVPALPDDEESVATLRQLLDGTDVARSGTTVTATYRAEPAVMGEALAVLLPLVGASMAARAATGGTATPGPTPE